MKRVSAVVATVAGALLLATTASAATITVTPSDVGGGDWFAGDTRPGGSRSWEPGPLTAPLGSESLRLVTTDSTAKVQLLTDRHADTPLASIDGIGYATYRDPTSTGFVAGTPSLNLRVDTDNNGTADAYMVYEPYQDEGNAAVLTGVWQTWDAYKGGAARWWINTGAGGCGQNTPCTWSTIVANLPGIAIREGTNVPIAPGSFGVNQGSVNPGYVTSVDALRISVGGQETVYDFDLAPEPEPEPEPDPKCKHGHGKHGHGGKHDRGRDHGHRGKKDRDDDRHDDRGKGRDADRHDDRSHGRSGKQDRHGR